MRSLCLISKIVEFEHGTIVNSRTIVPYLIDDCEGTVLRNSTKCTDGTHIFDLIELLGIENSVDDKSW